MNLTSEDISKAVAIFRSSPNLKDLELCRELVNVGFKRKQAARLVEFLPVVYCRLVFRDSGCQFADVYERRNADHKASTYSLSSDPIWSPLLNFASKEVGINPNQDFLVVAARSAEFDTINTLLNAGSKLEDVRLTATVFL